MHKEEGSIQSYTPNQISSIDYWKSLARAQEIELFVNFILVAWKCVVSGQLGESYREVAPEASRGFRIDLPYIRLKAHD